MSLRGECTAWHCSLAVPVPCQARDCQSGSAANKGPDQTYAGVVQQPQRCMKGTPPARSPRQEY